MKKFIIVLGIGFCSQFSFGQELSSAKIGQNKVEEKTLNTESNYENGVNFSSKKIDSKNEIQMVPNSEPIKENPIELSKSRKPN